jgi:hypothetical protein
LLSSARLPGFGTGGTPSPWSPPAAAIGLPDPLDWDDLRSGAREIWEGLGYFADGIPSGFCGVSCSLANQSHVSHADPADQVAFGLGEILGGGSRAIGGFASMLTGAFIVETTCAGMVLTGGGAGTTVVACLAGAAGGGYLIYQGYLHVLPGAQGVGSGVGHVASGLGRGYNEAFSKKELPNAPRGDWSPGPQPEPATAAEVDGWIEHSWQKHVVDQKEFPDVQSKDDLREVVEDVMENPTEWGYRDDGSIYWYDEFDNTIVIKNPAGLGGTVYRPTQE